MPLNDDQREMLQVNAARDRAEQLLSEMKKAFAEAEANAESRADLTDEQRELGELAMRKAMESTQRMLDSLNAALEIAQDAIDGPEPPSQSDSVDRT